MAIYCIDDGGDGSQDNTTQSAGTLNWSKADASVADLVSYDAAAFTTAGNIIYIGDDHNDPNKVANTTLTGASTMYGAVVISADRTQATPTYKKGTGNQLSSLGGAYNFAVLNGLVFHGIRIASGSDILFGGGADDTQRTYGCTVVPAANKTITANNSNIYCKHVDLTVDLTADGTTARTAVVFNYNGGGSRVAEFYGLTFVNAGYRTGTVWGGDAGNQLIVSGADFSGFTNGTVCEIDAQAVNLSVGNHVFANCLTAATWTPTSGAWTNQMCRIGFYNCGPADAPTYLFETDMAGTVVSYSGIYRTGGATVEGDACSWLITTTAVCGEGAPYYTPWIYGVVSSTGAKTFDLYITNDTADFDNSQVWLEVEYLSTSDEAIWALETDQRDNSTGAFISITEAVDAQTDDTTSTWTEISGSGTYSQTATTVTVTDTAHGLIAGNAIVVDVTGTGGVTDGTYTVVSTADADTFTFTASTGNGSGTLTWQMAPLYTYMQKLSVTATVNETGQFRARVAVGLASIASSRYFYIDPKVTVT